MRTLVLAGLAVFVSAAGIAQDGGMAFLPNAGQWDSRVRFAVRHGPMVSWLTDTGLTTRVRAPRPGDPGRAIRERAPTTGGVVVAMTLLGAAPLAGHAASATLPGRHHFLVGDDPTRWAADLVGCSEVRCPEVYPGIGLTLLQRGSLLSYDLTLAPGADPAAIALAFAGQDQLRIDPDGALVLVTELGELRHTAPRAFAVTAAGSASVDCGFVLRDASTVGFAVTGRPLHATLVIDPGLQWSGFLGGSNNDYLEAKNGMVVAQNGELLLVGNTASFDFPRNTGRTYAGLTDGFVTRYFASGAMRWSTFLGGSGYDMARGIAEKPNGELYVSGFTASGDFPIVGQAFQSTYGGAGPLGYGDGFLARLTNCGCFILWSTYLGGSDDESGRNVAVDASDRVYVTGWTNSPDFPIAGVPYQGTRASAVEEGFVALLDPAIPGNGQLVASTYLGGTGMDYPALLRLTDSGMPVVAGSTASAAFPTTANAFDPTYGGNDDGFLSMLDPSLSALVYSSYFGGSGVDGVNAMVPVPGGGFALAGWTDSAGLPTTANAWLPSRPGGANDGFVAVLDPAAPSQLVYGTFVGGPDEEGCNGIAFESSGMVTVVGSARASFPPPAGCFEPLFQGGGGAPHGPWDGFVARFDPARAGAAALIYGTYLGGSADWDWAYEVEIARDGGAFVAGVTHSGNFPILPPGSKPGGEDTFVSKLTMLPTGVDPFGWASACEPLYASVSSQPVGGNAGFEVWSVGAPPNTFGLLLLGWPVLSGQAAPFGVTSFVDLGAPIVVLPTISDARGFGLAPVPLPVGMVGPVGALQWAWLGSVSPCTLPLQSSNALMLTVQ